MPALPGAPRLEPNSIEQALEPGIVVKPVESRINVQEHHIVCSLLQSAFEKPQCLVFVTQTRMNQSDVIGRKVALGRQLIKLSQNGPSLVLLACNRIRVSELRAHELRASRAGHCLLKLGD